MEVNINLTGVEVQEGFDVLPVGWYTAIVEDSEIKDGPKGSYINWQFAIEGKPNKVWDIMSLGNEISIRRLKSLTVFCGHQNPNYLQDTNELHGARVQVRLKIETDDTGQYEPKNRISAFKPVVEEPQIIPATVAQTTINAPQVQQTPVPQTPPVNVVEPTVPVNPAPQKMPWE